MLASKSFAHRVVGVAKAIQDEVNAALGPTPEQRAADARPRVRLSEHEELELKLDCHYEMIQEQSALITGQRAAIEELRGWVQECSDGVSNLGMRVATLEDALEVVRLDTIVNAELSNANQDTGVENGARLDKHEARHAGLCDVLAAWMRATNAQVHRLLWGHPSLQQPTASERQAITRLELTIARGAEEDNND